MKDLAERTLVHLAALLLFAFAAGPVLLAAVGSVVPDRVLFDPDRSILDGGASLENYRYIFTGELPSAYMAEGANRGMISDAARQVPGALWNSAQIALSVMALNLVLGAPAAFAFARMAFPAKKAAFLFLILSPLVPTIALVLPVYMLIDRIDLLGSKLAVILVHTARSLPFTILILSVFFKKIPRELFEQSLLDGCDRFASFWRIALPLALPPVCATGLFAFMLSYTELLFAMVLSGDARSRPLSVVMAALARNTDVSWSLLNSAILLAILPTLALVVIVWRYIVEGLLSGAVKG